MFGVAQINTIDRGFGSSDVTNSKSTTNILDGLINNNHLKVNLNLANWYRNKISDDNYTNNYNDTDNMLNREANIDNEVIHDASLQSNVAVVVFGSTSREGRDLTNRYTGGGLGDWNHYSLTTDDNKVGEISEIDLLTRVCSNFNDVVVVFNTTTHSGLIMTDWGAHGTNINHNEFENPNNTFTRKFASLTRAGGGVLENMFSYDSSQPDNKKDVHSDPDYLNFVFQLENNDLTTKEAQYSVFNLLKFIIKTSAFKS